MKTNNLSIDLNSFKSKNISYTISSRMFDENVDIYEYVENYFPYIDISQVESFFGFSDEFSLLYGGRNFIKSKTIKETHLIQMEKEGIGVSLTLTNHFFDKKSYESSLSLLKQFHKEGNSIVCTNDDLALQIKKDFPLYVLKASLIKNLNTLKKVEEALKVYDIVVIPMEMNDNIEFLKSLPSKDRITLFANASCAYNCESRICYNSISKVIVGKPRPEYFCSKDLLPRDNLGFTFFDIEKLKNIGFSHFKLVPMMNNRPKKENKQLSTEELFIKIINNYKPIFHLFSPPKSGRTWLRFIIANYLNIKFNLNMKIDLHSMFSIFPNNGQNSIKGIGAYSYVQDQRFPALVAYHNSLDKTEINSNIIVLLRSVFDVMVSDYFQHVYFLKKFTGSIKEFIRVQGGVLYSYCKFLNAIESKSSNLHIITYEKMHTQIDKVIEDLLTFLNIPIDETIVKKSIELSTFENMKESEEKYGLAGKNESLSNPNGARVREGKVGSYTKYLDEDDIEFIKNFCENNLTQYSKKILKDFDIFYK